MKKLAITIGREFGSGGRELGKRLSDELGIAYYDKEIITEIAKRTALSEEYVHMIEESRPIVAYPIHVKHSFYLMPDPAVTQNISIYAEQHKIVTELAERSSCIIVGRCADYILKDEKPFRIFVYADEKSKIERCRERGPKDETLSDAQLKRKIAEIDRQRAKYYEFFCEQKWGVRENYDLLINTSGENIKKLSQSLAGYIKSLMEIE